MAEFPTIAGFKIISLLGAGGVAKVYLGIQEKLKRKVAIKFLNPFFLKDKVVASRFEREAKTAASLSHSNIIQIFDTGKSGDYYYIVMEYMEESLRERMKLDPQHKIHPDTALPIIEDILKALDYAHLRGVYHRDIKPENIMFRQDNTPVLVDFGIARVYDSSIQLTGSDSIIGTIHYMSPEQCNAVEVDGRSDVYSLGVVLFEMLTGEKPYRGKKWISVLHQHIEKPVPNLPRELNRYQPLIDYMMAKDREKRISTGAQFVRLLNRIMPPQ
ncbi:MAG: serine/threonine protein kinase [Candidatus Aminicenantes bacterium]|nr:MAG: serine/threonine protein kinase [Candidatus Aminicenantes bacterium]